MLLKTLSLLGPFLWKESSARWRCLGAFLTIGLDLGAALAFPYVSKTLVEQMQWGIGEAFYALLVLFGFLWIAQKTMAEVQELIFFPVINKAIQTLTHRVVMHVHALDLEAYRELSVPRIISSVRRIGYSARPFLRLMVLQGVPILVKLGAVIYGLIALGFFAFVPVFMLALILIAWGIGRYARTREKAWERSDKMNAAIHDSLLNSLSMRAFFEYESARMYALCEAEADGWQVANTHLYGLQVCLGGLLGVSAAVVLGLAAHQVSVGALALGDFVLLKAQLIALWLPFKQLTLGSRQVVEAWVDLKKLFCLLETPVVAPAPSLALRPPAPWVLQAEGLGFAYPGGNRLFEDLDLSVGPGSCLVIQGPSGCGKSTLATLCAGLQKPSQGTLFWGGIPMQQAQTFKKILYIPQDAHVLNATIRENVLYGLEAVSQEAINAALAAAQLADTVAQLPQGLETVLGELGVRFSGGQRQRLALARAYLMAPELLILDETLHALDPDCENTILHALRARIPALIIISHRDSCLQHATARLDLGNLEKGLRGACAP